MLQGQNGERGFDQQQINQIMQQIRGVVGGNIINNNNNGQGNGTGGNSDNSGSSGRDGDNSNSNPDNNDYNGMYL